MKCKAIHSKMIFYLENDLSKQERASFEDHLHNCSSCKEILQEMQQTLSVIETEKQVRPNPFAMTRIKAKIESHKDKHRIVLPQIQLTKTFRIAAAVVIFLIAGFSGVVLGNKYISNKIATSENSEYEYLAEQYFPDTYESETLENYLINQNE